MNFFHFFQDMLSNTLWSEDLLSRSILWSRKKKKKTQLIKICTTNTDCQLLCVGRYTDTPLHAIVLLAGGMPAHQQKILDNN